MSRSLQRMQAQVRALHSEKDSKRTRIISEQVIAERKAKFPIVTDANFAEVDAWQEARYKELRNTLKTDES